MRPILLKYWYPDYEENKRIQNNPRGVTCQLKRTRHISITCKGPHLKKECQEIQSSTVTGSLGIREVSKVESKGYAVCVWCILRQCANLPGYAVGRDMLPFGREEYESRCKIDSTI